MFLTRIAERARRDDGVAMVAVVALVAVMVVVTAAVATSVTSAQSFTSSTEASVQSQSAAEAGIAAARAGLIAGTCGSRGAVYSSGAGTTPAYSAKIYTSTDGTTWSGSPNCPASIAVGVKIVSTGYAVTDALGGVSNGDETVIEAILSSEAVTTSIVPSGPAIFAYSSNGFGGGGQLLSEDGGDASVMVKQGDVNCDGGASGDVDMVVQNGNLTVAAGCNITGDIWASGTVTMPGGPDVGGNVVGSALNLSGGSKVHGSVWVTGAITMSGNPTIGGNASGASLDNSNGTINGNVVVTGNASLAGGGSKVNGNITAKNLTFGSSGTVGGSAWIFQATTVTWGSRINGYLTTKTFSKVSNDQSVGDVVGHLPISYSPGTSSPLATNGTAPPSPIVPAWYDFTFQAAHWTGFAVIAISGTTCSYNQLQAAVNAMAGQPGVIDARACTNGVKIGGSDKLTFTSDLAIITNKFDFGGGGGFRNANAKRLWLITPDTVANSQPNCPAGGGFDISGGFDFSSTLDVMIYTPCQVNLASGTAFHGQVFSGKASVSGGAQLTYAPVGLPGVDLNTGTSTVATHTEADRSVVSQRIIDDTP